MLIRYIAVWSNAAFTALRVSSETPVANTGLKLREVSSANLLGMTLLPLTDIVTAPCRYHRQGACADCKGSTAARLRPMLSWNPYMDDLVDVMLIKLDPSNA